jgi:hypothetical protein
MSREAIGKGASGIFGVATKNLSDPQSSAAEAHTSATEPHTTATEPHTTATEPHTSVDVAQGIDSKALDQAVSEAIKYPKITIWSTTIAAIMRYNQITTTRYSMSREAKAKLKQVLHDEYPELWEEIKKRLPEGLDAE